MNPINDDDDEATALIQSVPVTAAPDDESDLARRAGAGDQQAFDLLYDRYFARTSWYFTIFGKREAKTAVQEVLTELFGSINEPSELSFAERAYRLSIDTELRHASVAKAASKAPAKATIAKHAKPATPAA
jgi:hypothetical protein